MYGTPRILLLVNCGRPVLIVLPTRSVPQVVEIENMILISGLGVVESCKLAVEPTPELVMTDEAGDTLQLTVAPAGNPVSE